MSSNGDKKSVAFEGQVDLGQAIDYLRSLQTGLEHGTVFLQNGGDSLSLEPEANLTMEVEARSKKGKQSIKLSLRWEKVEEVEVAHTDSFTILDHQPEPSNEPAFEG